MRSHTICAHACVILLCTSFLAPAQIGTSTLTGRVTDSSGAVVPNVKLTVTAVETNFQYTATTNAEGLYRVQSLAPGPYRLVFDTAGFKRLVRENVDLRTGDTLAVDAALEVGNVTESIEVTGAVGLLETETSATGAVVEGKLVYDLPLFQRYVASSLNLLPGMTAGGYAYEKALGGFHIAGQRATAIAFYEDGVNANDQLGGTNTINPIENSLEEVKVLTTTLPAEYGHSAGGALSVVKKTGTNQLHGMASEYGRTRSMQHRDFFSLYKASQPSPGYPNGVGLYFQMPDFSLGGPVVLPKLYNGRNRTFFFVSKAYLLERESVSFTWQNPNEAMKNGDFSFGGIGNPLYDPASTRQLANGTWVRDPIPGSIIPKSRFDPVANKVLQFDPWKPANQPGSYNANGPVSNVTYAIQTKVIYDEHSLRLDHQFGPNFKMYGSWTKNWVNGYAYHRNLKPGDFDNRSGAMSPTWMNNYSIGKTWIINPTTINDARIGYFRRRNERTVSSYMKDYGKILGIPNITPEMLPSFGTGDLFGPDSIYGLTIAGPNRTIGETISFRDDFTKIRGTHAFKAGYEVLRFRLNNWNIGRPSGDFRFDTMTAGLQADGNTMPRTGNTFAGFLMGYVRQVTFDRDLTSWLPRSAIHSFYFQDDWKVSPQLTLNLGIRYSNESPFNTKYRGMSNFSPTATDDLTGRIGAIVHPTSQLNKRDNNNFQPRFGVAWHPLKKWVFRGGFAVNTVDVKFPSSRGQFEEYNAVASQQRAPGDPRPLFQISRGPDPVVFNIRSNNTAPFLGTNYSARSSEWWDPNLRNPYVLNFNLGVQYEVRPDYLLEVSYQGSSGVGLVERWQANTFPIDYAKSDPVLQAAVFRAAQNYRPFPQFGDVRFRSNFGHSTYHSGTVKLEKRFSQGLLFTTFYTFSKAIDSQDNDNDGTGVAPIQNRSLEKAVAGYNRSHRYVAAVTYQLPLGKGKRFLNRGGVWNHLFGGYEIAWTQDAETGNPLTFSFANSPYNYYPTFAGNRRANVVGKPGIRDNWRDLGGDRFNLANINPVMDVNVFAYPAAFTVGNSGRNIVTGVPLLFSCASAKKNIRISERFNFQVRWDMQNVLKIYNYDPPTTTVDFQNPKTFGKLGSNAYGAVHGGFTLMNLTFQLRF